MRKPIFVLTAFLLIAAVTIPTYANISAISWIGTANNGSADMYYNQTANATPVYAYKEGTQAVAAITVGDNVQMTNVSVTPHQTVSVSINVTRVYVSFDWGLKVNSTQASPASPVSLSPLGEYTFYINFTVPSVAVVSNLYVHSYTVYANYEYYNVSNHYQTITGTFSYFRQNFVVYSADQAAAVDLSRTISIFLETEPKSSLQSAQAQILYDMAANETANANRYYLAGNFTLAKESYTTALNNYNSALSDEESYQMMNQSLTTTKIQAETAAINAWASFLNGFSTLWVLLGIGWVLIGIGYIIKVIRVRRPETPAPPAAST
jgi:hypothetical protein